MTTAIRRPAWLTFGALAIALAWDAAGLDLPLARLAASPLGFPWRDHWLLTEVLHEGGRRLAWGLALVLWLGVWWPAGPLARLPRGERLRLALSALLAALGVALLKAASATSCPWDLVQFGGVVPYTPHWSAVADGGPGRCFPAGHASSGFSFVGGYFAFLPVDPWLARTWLVVALAAGLLLGLGQQWRGAHFMSHTLWTAVTCCAVAWAVHWPWQTPARAGRCA